MNNSAGSRSATEAETKRTMRRFWGDVYRTAYREDVALTPSLLRQRLDELEDMFRYQGHGAVVEMPLDALRGKSVLEIGAGAGGHSALFAFHGARMISVDITWDRAASTAKKFALLGDDADGCTALQGDAEMLAFADDTFDIVYSNGVLHHTPNTERAIAEVLRVLKPGGLAVIMLYSKSSFHYWFTLFFCVGILQGGLLRGRDWIGPATEWIGRTRPTSYNPITRCYSAHELRRLFAGFVDVSLRKMGFFFYAIPKIGRLYRRWQIKHYGVHPGGILVYGEPWPYQSPLERWLGRYIGFAWFISARKPARTVGVLDTKWAGRSND